MVSDALRIFREHVKELAATWYDDDQTKAFRHAAFAVVTDPNMADQQVIEATAIDDSGDLEIDGWFLDEAAEALVLFQSAGGRARTVEAKVSKFWQSPIEALNPVRVAASRNQALEELVPVLNEAIRDGYSVSLIFASRGGFVPSANSFAASKASVERNASLADGTSVSFGSCLELLDENEIASRFEAYRAGPIEGPIEISLTVASDSSYEVNGQSGKSLRATVSAAEIIKVFRAPNVGYRLFQLNPRGPLANARVNKGILTTLDDPSGRASFHLLNNGICAVCDEFDFDGSKLTVRNFQIVNGCQTTVALSKKNDEILDQTLVDLKLAVADGELAQRIATTSNSQTALRARDYAAFERQQQILKRDFDDLQPPWYYEIKQGYWRSVLLKKEKAKYKTGNRKHHIEVQPLAQASLAFLGHPSEALDKVRFVFEGIRNEDERKHYEAAFPRDASAVQLLLPWRMLDYIEHYSTRLGYSTFHMIWLIAEQLRSHYGLNHSVLLPRTLAQKLTAALPDWMPGMAGVANQACRAAYRRAQPQDGPQIGLREFFRPPASMEWLQEAFARELEIESEANRNPLEKLPAP